MAKKINPDTASKVPKKEGTEAVKLAQYRQQTKMLLLQNPNYFGTFKGKIAKQYSAVVQLASKKSHYEGLGCIDYNPETKILGTSVMIKQSSGYSGSPCFGGSIEYVRFFVDYDHSGTWVDEGLAEFGVYDHKFNDPLCYYAKINLAANLSSCCNGDPVLPKVRAILSWNQVPTAGDPDYNPVWGEIKESYIQIAPNNTLWCYILDTLKPYEKFKIDWPEIWKPDFEKKYLPELQSLMKDKKPPMLPGPLPNVLKKAYGKSVPDARIAHPYIQPMAKAYSDRTNYELKSLLTGIDIPAVIDFQTNSNFNTTFEELRCVSLDKDESKLHASVQMKLSSGYNGNLCTAGSKEYVAFYMDFGSGWEYMGTRDVVVHDIEDIPVGGLWYDVSLSVNLDAHRKKWCEVGKAKLRGILSWSIVPTPNDPDYVAPWGDWEECVVELKPLPSGVVQDNYTVVLEKCGGMIVDDINFASGLATKTFANSLDGFESPFYGVMELIGYIFFAPPDTFYRFMVTQPGGTEHALLDTQTITIDTLGVITDVVVNPDPNGWMPYLLKKDANNNVVVNIVGGLLGRLGAYTEGMYSVRIEAMYKVGTNMGTNNYNIYNPRILPVNFLVDAQAPELTINLDPPVPADPGATGNCGDFVIPNKITGNYSMSDAHSGSFSIYITPSNGAVVKVDAKPVSGFAYAIPTTADTLANAGRSGTFEIFTDQMIKCGYNVRIDAVDRTLIHSHIIGHRSSALQGFCLRLT